MRDDDKFEIMRAMDMLPHVAGASFATVWFRLNGNRRPTRDEFRIKTTEYLSAACDALESFPDTEKFVPIKKYIRKRIKTEIADILNGKNGEIEKRYDRYVDYG